MNVVRPAWKMLVTLIILTGFIYPLFVTVISQLVMPRQANGSLIKKGNTIIGSELIAQNFKGQNYFWPRPSAIDFDPIKPSGGSNLGPTSQKLKETIDERAKALNSNSATIPSELVYASGSGLDPHISLDAAYFQMERVAKARSIPDPDTLKALINSLAEGSGSYVNVLLLNQALDQQFLSK